MQAFSMAFQVDLSLMQKNFLITVLDNTTKRSSLKRV